MSGETADVLPLALTLPLGDEACLIEADAGSGKTWTLSTLAVRLLVEHRLQPEQILITTFTKNAAAELKQRVRNRLRAFERVVSSTLNKDEQAQTGSGDLAILQTYLMHLHGKGLADLPGLRGHLFACLAGIDRLQVHTIHGFCQQTLQQWAALIGLPSPITVDVEGADQIKRLFSIWWTDLLGSLNSQQLAGLDQLGVRPAQLLDRIRLRLDLPMAPLRPAPVDDIGTALMRWSSGRNARQLESLIQAQLEPLIERLSKNHPEAFGVSGVNYRAQGLKKIVRWIHSMADGVARPTDFKLEEVERWHVRQMIAAGADPERIGRFELLQVVDTCLYWLKERGSIAAALVNLAAQWIQLELRKQQLKTGALGYSDQIDWLFQAVSDPAHGARVVRGVQQQFRAMLVDECQDTDARQWAILGALFGGHSRAPVVMVGDPKQAVYKFRGADVQAYVQIRENGLCDTDGCYRPVVVFTLDTNQRSTPEVIASVNRLLANKPVWLDPGLSYRGARRGVIPMPVVNDTWWGADAGEPGTLGIWLPEKMPMPDLDRIVSRAIVAELRRLMDPAQVSLDGAPVSPRDIAILVNTHAQAAFLSIELQQAGIPVALQRYQKPLFSEVAARDLVLVLDAIVSPLDSMKRRAAARILGVSDDLKLLAPFQTLQAQWSRQRFMLPSLLDRMPARGISASGSVAPDHCHLWREMLELLLNAPAAAASALGALRWLEEAIITEAGKDERVLPEAPEAVGIMTSFAAKGLEFAFVMVPFAWRKGRSKKYSPALVAQGLGLPSWLDVGYAREGRDQADFLASEMADAVRKFYVAITRAKVRTVLFLRNGEVIKHLQDFTTTGGAHQGEDQQLVARTIDIESWLEKLTPWVHGAETTEQPPIDHAPNIQKASSRACLLQPIQNLPEPSVWPNSFTSLLRQRVDPALAGYEKILMDLVPRPLHETVPPELTRLPSVRVLGARGMTFGVQIHRLLASETFSRPLSEFALRQWRQAALASQSVSDPAPESPLAEIKDADYQTWWQTIATWPLTDASPGTLSEWRPAAMSHEWAFEMRVSAIFLNRAMPLLQRFGIDVPDLARISVAPGLMKGSIDLVLMDDRGRFHLLDWKTNMLGEHVEDYDPAALEKLMVSGGYHLQWLLYAVALHRLLAKSMPAYDPAQHLGDAHFIFLRGLAVDAHTHSGHWKRPLSAELILGLDRLLLQEFETEV